MHRALHLIVCPDSGYGLVWLGRQPRPTPDTCLHLLFPPFPRNTINFITSPQARTTCVLFAVCLWCACYALSCCGDRDYVHHPLAHNKYFLSDHLFLSFQPELPCPRRPNHGPRRQNHGPRRPNHGRPHRKHVGRVHGQGRGHVRGHRGKLPVRHHDVDRHPQEAAAVAAVAADENHLLILAR